jgi:hypothetical protein
LARPEQKSVTLSGAVLKQLEAKYEAEKKKRPTLSFASFIAESAIIELERRDMLREGVYISKVAFENDVLFLKDAKKLDRTIEVQIKNKKLKCLTDDDSDCIHVGFALALPEIRKALASR